MTLSVAMCTYNGARYVREQLESILQQELPVDEIVVCDDGSKDETLTIVREVAEQHPEVHWNIQQNSPNLGVTKNFEKALTLCTGDILFLSDQDDLWRKDKTRVICDYFQQHPDKSVIFTDAELIDGDGHSLSEHGMLDYILLLPNLALWRNGLEFDILAKRNRATGATMALRKSFLTTVLPFEGNGLHDELLTMIACLHGCLDLLPEKLISYRQHGDNVVGIRKANWIYTGEPCPSLLREILDTVELKPCYRTHPNSHYLFYLKRYQLKQSMHGKLKLICSLSTYRREYHQYWVRFFYTDMRYALGILLKLRHV